VFLPIYKNQPKEVVQTMISAVITTINPNSKILRENLKKFIKLGYTSYVPLDRKVSGVFDEPFLNYRDEPQSEFERMLGFDTYARKNIGYIRASNHGADFIVETDDDNLLLEDITPYTSLLENEATHPTVHNGDTTVSVANLFDKIYDTNSNENIWARGLPIDCINNKDFSVRMTPQKIGVIQFLVQNHPDVDAIVRLVKGEDHSVCIKKSFESLAIKDVVHPFNSQGTLWPKKNFPLMYLPSTCNFRMTDIWRGYIAQQILFKRNEGVLFSHPLFKQDRNFHVISEDFYDEHSGYIQSKNVIKIADKFSNSDAKESLLKIYTKLGEKGIVDLKVELKLLTAFLNEID